MSDFDSIIEVEMFMDEKAHGKAQALYREITYHALRELILESYFDPKWPEDKAAELFKKKLLSIMPIVKICPSSSSIISFYTLLRYRMNAFKFFFNLVSQWLIPGKRLNVVLVHAVDLRFPKLGEEIYTLCEVMVQVDSLADLEKIQQNFPLIETEARFGLDSEYYARKILEIKGVTPDQKTTMIQQHIASLIERMPGAFSQDIFTEMQHILVLCHDEFKHQRTISHLSRIISAHYLFRKQLLQLMKEPSEKRHILVKVFKTSVDFPQGRRQVLALTLGVNFLRDKEIFDERHLVRAIQQILPDADAIDQTFFSNRKGAEQFSTIYIEIENREGKSFSFDDLQRLKTDLPKALQTNIVKMMHPVFMPRNEEEIMRNMLSLVSQIKYLRDIPQVYISFDEQSDRNLFFLVIFVRVLKEDERPIQDKIRHSETFLKYIHDRTKIVGHLRKRYPKEATVFRVKFPKDGFLRGDHSIDLYRARQAVVSELGRVLGDFRDFNGGMIAKQNELLTEVRGELSRSTLRYNDLFLENFFYSLTPVIMRTVLETHAFKTCFQFLLEVTEKGLPKGQKVVIQTKYEMDFSYVILGSHQRFLLDELTKGATKFHQGSDFVQGFVRSSGNIFMALIYHNSEPYKQALFREWVESLDVNNVPKTMATVSS